MSKWLEQNFLSCLSPMGRILGLSKDDDLRSLLWTSDVEDNKHAYGEFSFAVMKANVFIEDHSQVEIGKEATLVGIYDGHSGPDASRYIADNLCRNLTRLVRENRTFSEDILRNAVAETEEGFLNLVRQNYNTDPRIAKVGSCCLVGIIWRGSLYVANLGDSRAVIGCLDGSGNMVLEQLTTDHNVNVDAIREEVEALHPDDPEIVVFKRGSYRIKGIIQVSRAIGDAYLKQPGDYFHSSLVRAHELSAAPNQPVLTAQPSVERRVLQPTDRFLIFASDGLWAILTNEQVVDIITTKPREGIARTLIRRALKEAAKKNEMSFNALKKIREGRRNYHDDISVVVIYLDHLLPANAASVQERAIHGFDGILKPLSFNIPLEIGSSTSTTRGLPFEATASTSASTSGLRLPNLVEEGEIKLAKY
ncbi:hypothetical protein SLE2022_063430 [Rubroshorea leprosula]